MQDITTQVLSVQAVASKDNQSFRYEVKLTGGQAADGTQYPAEAYVAWPPRNAGETDLGAKAQALVGSSADARVEIKQVPKKRGGGFFTNYVLHDIAQQGGLPQMAMPAAGGTPAQPEQVQPAATPPPPNLNPQTHQHPLVAAEDTQRSKEDRRSVIHAATEYVGGLLKAGLLENPAQAADALRQSSDDLLVFVNTGTWGGPAQTPQTAQEVAAAVPGVSVGVPFDSTQ